MRLNRLAGFAAVLVALSTATASAQMRITEWMYSGNGGEFIEFTNFGPGPVSLAGWSYDDDSRVPGTFDLTPLTASSDVAVGESVVITEDTEAVFRATWSLPSSVKVLGGYTNNIGRNDEINLYDDLTALVDRLTYGDQDFPGSIRTQEQSGNPISLAALGANDAYQWQLATVGDMYGSYTSLLGDVGNPGTFVIPEPSSVLLMVMGSALLLGARLRKFARTRRAG
ncbi:MAG: lamin tail domain-containing protein [Planctomycetota bacterium]|nr:MAG: lamin tail domain-containing protein [Planctomycetota bacterium]